ncbi:response regulator transcription factor (plasmid) [Methylobacterium currus]|uniref:response regulator transcription factor n=1 Tax=Methylobacterium currus TaxID=2051553 RepID=UPI001E3F13F0|nr:response regulator transcription factor [Methylobacterium currus]UHC20099.1 response regulator transcription factor [Methylobacterium currus]
MSRRDGPAGPTVFIVDDDPDLRAALAGLFRSVDLAATAYASAAEFLGTTRSDGPGCLVLDVRMPGLSGLDFQAQLESLGIHLPVILMTGHGDIPMSVRAMKAGAVDFLTKPFRDQDMLDAVTTALARDAARRSRDSGLMVVRTAYETLTAREREVFAHVTAGLMNKQIAGLLDLSEITIKIHRGHVMRKMAARSLADLVRMAQALGIAQN